MKTSFLGKSSKRIKKSGRNLLDSISRTKEDINYGSDIWNVYDFMYLDKNKTRNPKTISGWGLYPKIKAIREKPKTIEDLRNVIISNSLIARGNGRSYGDSAINILHTIDMTEFNRFLHFNEKEGLIIAQAGILLKDILETFIPRGWFPPVTPGTKYATLGGMVAANVHGKNHYKSGTFSKYIKWIET